MAAHAKFTMNGSPSATCINSVAAWTGAALKAWTANPVATALKATYVSRDDERPRQSTSAITLILSHSLSKSPESHHPSFIPSSFIIVSHIPIHIIIRARATRPVPSRAIHTRDIPRARHPFRRIIHPRPSRARARALIRTNGVLTSSSHPTQSFPIAISPSQTAIRFPGHRSRAIRKPSSSRSIDTRARTRAHIACANVLDALATRERTKRIPFHSVFAILIIPSVSRRSHRRSIDRAIAFAIVLTRVSYLVFNALRDDFAFRRIRRRRATRRFVRARFRRA